MAPAQSKMSSTMQVSGSAGNVAMPAYVIEGILKYIVSKWQGIMPPGVQEQLRADGLWDKIFCLQNEYIAALGVMESAG